MIVVLIFVMCTLVANADDINWQGNWAFSCDFDGNNLKNVQSQGKDCGGLCANTPGCTHFSWTPFNGGTCWMKQGQVSKSDAKYSNVKDIVCGVVVDNSNSNGIVWIDNWASSCDFKNNDLTNKLGKGENCNDFCLNTPGCTHYSWTSYNGGTCWLKQGSVSKSDAVKIDQENTMCGLLKTTGNDNQGDEVLFRIINNCPYTIWPAILGSKRSDLNWRVPLNGGWELASGQKTEINLPKDFNSGRIWGRTGCSGSNCESGNPASLAEFNLADWSGLDFYDISLVDGFNLPMTINVLNPNFERSDKYYCKNPSCKTDINSICKDELKQRNSQGQVVACLSACTKFHTDQYCCTNAFNSPQACKSSAWPFDYPSIFKNACPDAYSYAYDDAKSTFTCKNTGYEVVFC